MNLHWLDWMVVFCFAGFLLYTVIRSQKHVKSTADFLAANRCAGRYLLTISEGIATMGAVSIVAIFQMNYNVGFAANWWGNVAMPVSLIMSLTGWIIYRYRETRVLTLAQFFEIRYSRKFRIFAAMICWISGIINFGIFPAVGANFFIHYCGLPESYLLAGTGISIPTYHSLMVLLVGISLYFAFAGGQITVLITDFIQSSFCSIVFVVILILLLIKYPLSDVFDGLLIAEKGKSMVNPFDAGASAFNPLYFIIGIISGILNRYSWQGTQAYNCSAKSPHEAKMAGVLASFRTWGFLYALTLIPLVAYMIMHHPNYSDQANQVTEALSQIESQQIRDQMIVPTTMTLYMPIGLMGAFAALMFAAFVSTHDTYMHSWGSIFVQDILIPLRKKALTNEQHLKLLRWSMFFVAAFILVFSSIYRQTQHILMFFALTGAIWLGGVGVVIVGGLYTRWGNTIGAYAALISGTTLAGGGMILEQVYKTRYDRNFFLTGQEIYGIAMGVALVLYTVFSLLGRRKDFNLEKMLHRGEYRIKSDHVSDLAAVSAHLPRKWRFKDAFGINEDFTLWDKFIYGITIVQSFAFFLLFIGMTVYAISYEISDRLWADYHRYVLWFYISTSFIIAVWLGIGGVRDLVRLLRDLKASKRDLTDDGRVTDHDY